MSQGKEAKLIKDGKVGRKLFTTHYPLIEPLYDSLEGGSTSKLVQLALFDILK